MSKTNYVNPFRLNALISFLFHCDGDRGIVKRRDLKAAWQGDSLGSAVPQDQLWLHSPVGKCMWQHHFISVPKYSVYMTQQSLWMVSEHEVLDTRQGSRLCVQWMEAMLWTLLTKKIWNSDHCIVQACKAVLKDNQFKDSFTGTLRFNFFQHKLFPCHFFLFFPSVPPQ